MSIELADIIADPTKVDKVSAGEIPALLGELETVRAKLWGRLNRPSDLTNQSSPVDSDRLVTVEQAAELLAFTEQYVYELIRKREMPAIRQGKYLRIKLADLKTWTDKHREVNVDNELYNLYSKGSGRKRASKNQKIARSDASENGRSNRSKPQHSSSVGTGRVRDFRAHLKVHSSIGPNEEEAEGNK